MAANNIVIGLSADSSKVSSVLKSTSKELSSFLGVDRFIKLQLDDTDFRKKYQDDIRLAREELKKLKLETYTAANGKEVRITSKNAVKARDRFIDMADQAKKSGNAALEKSYIAKANAVTQYANALYALNIVEKANATLQEKQLGLESRIQAAENTGKVNAKRRLAEAKAMKEALAEVNAEDIKRVSSQITQAQNRLSNARHMKDEVESLRGQIAANRELNKLYRQRAKLSGIDSDKDIALSYGRANQVANEELQRIKSNERVRKEQEAYNKAVFEADSKRRRQKAQEERQATKEQEAFDKAVFNDRSKRMRKQQAEEARIAREREKAQKAVNRTESRISELNRTNRLRGGNDTGTISRLIQQYDKLAISARKAGDAQKAASAEANSSRLRRQYEALTALNGGYEKQHGILSKLKSIASRYFSIFTVIDVAKKIANTTGYFQQQQVALEGILRSASRAQETITEIKSMALRSPFETKDIVTQTKQLAAYGIEYEKLLPTVKQLGDLSTGLGVDMSRLVLAFGQVRSASVLRGQELRQFTEAGVPMVDALAKKFTELNGKLVTTADIFEMISRRQVSFEMVNSVLSDMTSEGGKFYNMQEKMTDSLYGQIQKLKDLWTLALNNTGSAIVPSIVKIVKGLQGATKHMMGILSGAALTFGMKAFGQMSMSLLQMAQNASLFKIRMLRAVVTIRQATTAAGKLAGVMALVKNFSGIFTAISMALGVVVGKIVDAHQAAKEFRREINGIESSFAKQLYEQTEGLDKLVGKLATSTKGTREYEKALETLKTNYGEYINPAIIDQLIKERQAINATGEAWSGLRDSIVAAMRAKMDYEMYGAKGTAAAQKLKDKFDPTIVLKRAYNSYQTGSSQSSGVESYNKFLANYGVNPTEFRNSATKMNSIINVATENFFNNLGKTEQEYIDELESQAKLYAPQLQKAMKTVGASLFEKLTSNQEIWNTYLSSLELQSGSPFKKTRDAFDRVEKEQRQGSYFVKTGNAEKDRAAEYAYNPFKTSNEIGAGYMKAILDGKNGILEQFSKLNGEDLTEEGKKIWKSQYDNIIQALTKYSKDFRVEAVKEVSDDFMLLANSIKNLPLRGVIIDLVNELQNRIAALTNDEARIADRLRTNYGANTQYSVETKDFMARYTPTKAGDFERIRKQLISDYKEAQDEIDSYKDKTGEWAPRIKELRNKQDLLKVLGSSQYYNIDVTGGAKTSRTGSSKGNWAQFLNGFIDLIKTASNSEKQLVEGVDGYTQKLVDDIQTLEDSPLKDFYNAGTNPFEKYLQTIKDYDLEGFFTKEDFDKLTTKFLEGVGPDNINAADYRTIWKDLIQIMSNKVNTTANAADKERLKSVLRNMEKEFETFFGKQEISALIEKNLKELTNINSSIKTIERKNDIFNRISASGGLVSAQSAMYGGANYSSYNFVKTVSDKLSRYVGADAFGGFASTLVGSTLKKISDEGQFGLQHIVTLLNALEELAKTTKSGNVTDRAGNLVAASEEFKSIVPEISSLIEEMIEAILKEYEKLREANPNYINQNNDISNAYSRFIDRNNTARTLDEPLRDRALAESSQKFFSDIAKIMNGPDLANWIKDLFANVGSTNGTRGGIWAQAFLGDSSLMDIITMAKMNKLEGIAKNEGQQAFEEKLKISTEKLNKFSSSMSMVNAILSSIDNVLHGTIEAVRKYLDMLDSQNKLTTDEYGNYTKTYDTTKSRMQLDAADQFLNDFIPIKSLMSGDITGVLNFIPNTIMGLIESINKIKDQGKQDEQDELISSNKALEKAMGDLTFALEDAAGKDKFDNKYQQIANLQQQQLNYESLLALEESKKSGDADKAEEYRQAADDAKKQQESMLREIQNEILGTADEIAATLTDAFVEAFRNGTNAAREWRDSVKSYISDILKEQLLQNVFAPEIQKAISDFGINEGMSSDAIISLLKDPEAVGNLESEMFRIGDKMNDTLNSLDPRIQAWIGYKSSDTALSGGIESITEDTARRLEALQNSQLGEIVMLRLNSDILVQESYSMSSSLKSMVGSAQRIDANTLAIRTAIDEMRIGTRPLNVSIV